MTTHPFDAEEDCERNGVPLFSILNVVVDHIMVPPSPLESVEFQVKHHCSSSEKDKLNNVRVPVLRIFGPIVRRDIGGITVPQQSACLYIHGAFPYLLARPVVAGPDGSIHRSSHLKACGKLNSSAQVDWDSVESVKQILSEIQATLEAALQSSVQQSDVSAQPSPPFIRRITVVVGRGFYTYSPGPPAPFLKVQYYHPKHRWRVKMMLERGLDIPLRCHPDPRQYNATLTPPTETELGMEALSFNCYEGHIPYTMQFFKDFNLAGMSYIHISDGRFRSKLPTQMRQKSAVQESSAAGALFLQSNTPAKYLWSASAEPLNEQFRLSENSELGNIGSLEQPSLDDTPNSVQPKPDVTRIVVDENLPTDTEAFWTERETSCDLEIDTTIEQILNVRTVMKTLPADEEERLQIHWRAVPSLREIWLQERRRMAKLLQPQDDIITQMTQNQNTSFTLSVRKGESISGAKLAALGMKRLFRLSNGLSGEFDRCLKQIILRHTLSVSKVDRLLLTKQQQSPSVSGTVNSPSQSAESVDSAVEALGALRSQFNEIGDNAEYQASFRCSPVSQSDCSRTVFRSFHSTPDGLLSSQACATQDPLEFSQRVDRGDSVLEGWSPDADETIDPYTLTPYEDVEDDDYLAEECEMSEGDVEQVLSCLATQLTSRDDDCEPPLLGRDASFASDSDESLHTMTGDHDEIEGREYGTSRILDASLPCQQIKGNSTSLQSDVSLSETISELNRIAGPPSAKVFIRNKESHVRLHSLQTDGRPVPWLVLSARYDQVWKRKRDSQAFNAISTSLSSLGRFSEPVRGPPLRRQVEQWSRRVLRREQPPCDRSSKKRCIVNSEKKSALMSSTLEIDGNSRKITTIPKQPKRQRRVEFAETIESSTSSVIQEIENADFGPSQQSQIFSMSPSQSEERTENFDDLRITPSKVESASSLDYTSVEVIKGMRDEACGSLSETSGSGSRSYSQNSDRALKGIGQQGGKIYIEGGGGLKAKTRGSQLAAGAHVETSQAAPLEIPSPITMMSVEIHVQCRSGRAGSIDAKEIAMKPDYKKDEVFAVVYVFACDPGGGEQIQIIERGCLFVPNESERVWDQPAESDLNNSLRVYGKRVSSALGLEATRSPLIIEPLRDEKKLILRVASVVRLKDPDMLLSWDTQGAGIGYLVERGSELGIDLARLFGRIPRASRFDDDSGTRGSLGYPTSSTMERGTKTGQGANDAAKSRVSEWQGSGLGSEWDDRVGAGAAAASIFGRLVFAGWKVVGEEVKHPNASYLPAMVSTVLNKRIPFHDDLTLTRWYGYDSGRERWRVLHYRLQQAQACILMFDALDIVGRAGEAARLSGVEFSQSFPGIRGSQYKVEGVLLRALQSLNSDERGAKRGRQKVNLSSEDRALAIDPTSSSLSSESKSESQSPFRVRRKLKTSLTEWSHMSEARQYFFFSPSNQDCTRQEALETQALTLEPKSGFQHDPVVVCDFTALYPSLVIAYNLCYSTCAGKLEYHSTRQEMREEGKTTGKLGPFQYTESRTATILQHHVKSLFTSDQHDGEHASDRAYAAPTGSIYVGEAVLKGVLPQVLDEILRTRAMLKKAARQYKALVPGLSSAVLRQLEARQLALKYVANVTYGYTSATFSGRCAMPLLADTIVECGRRTLSNAIALANDWGRDKNGKWCGAEVIYGDTDSLFVKLPGRSVAEAFEFGEVFCKAVTASNPPPIQLKLEKVYHGSMMQTKKKYCGMKYEYVNQKKPEFEAKGIETIRRDQCALTQKVLRNALITLFRSGIDAVKPYLERQWSLIRSGRLPVSDFILTGRVRSRYRGGRVGPVQAALARRLAEADPGRVVRHKERLAYVIVATPGQNFRLRDCVLTPMELLERWDAFTIHSAYYTTKHVNAALQRCLGLAPYKIDVNMWYEMCPKPRLRIHFWPVTRAGTASMISSFFGSDICSLCGRKCGAQGSARAVVCSACQRDRSKAVQLALRGLQMAQEKAHSVAKLCSACNLCYEDANTFGVEKPAIIDKRGKARANPGIFTPIANCTCIDCPITFERSLLRDAELEAIAVAKALGLLYDG